MGSDRPVGKSRWRHLLIAGATAGWALSLLFASPAAAAPNAVRAPVRTVRVAWGTIGYRVVGRGRPIVLVTGYSDSIDDWAPRFVDDLARHHRVFALDNEGVGNTTLRSGNLTISRMGDDVAAFIAALGLRQPDVLGWSMGGDIVQAFAVRHPGSLRRLILAAAAPGDGSAVPASGLRTAPPFANFFPTNQDAARSAFVADMGRYPNFCTAPASVDQLQGMASQDWMDGLDPAGRHPWLIRVPVLIGDGAEDHLNPPANSRALARKIPHAQLHLYPDAAHGFWFQDAADWVRRIGQFLS